jgi:hypothetical protein
MTAAVTPDPINAPRTDPSTTPTQEGKCFLDPGGGVEGTSVDMAPSLFASTRIFPRSSARLRRLDGRAAQAAGGHQ